MSEHVCSCTAGWAHGLCSQALSPTRERVCSVGWPGCFGRPHDTLWGCNKWPCSNHLPLVYFCLLIISDVSTNILVFKVRLDTYTKKLKKHNKIEFILLFCNTLQSSVSPSPSKANQCCGWEYLWLLGNNDRKASSMHMPFNTEVPL